MPLVPIPVPPGVIKPATPLQAKGRYWDSNLVRWQSNKLLPVGGWQRINSTPLDSAVRTIFPWTLNNGVKLAALGCDGDLYVQEGATYTNITPANYVSAETGLYGGYGAGDFGELLYGLDYASYAITSAVRSTNVVTITTAEAHSYPVGMSVLIAGVTTSTFDGTFTIASVPTTTTFTYAQTAADASSSGGTSSLPVADRRPLNTFYGTNFTWTMDNWGEDLLSVASSDGRLLHWEYGNGAAQVVGFSTITTAVSATNVITITTAQEHDFRVGDTIVIAGVADTRFNGTFTITAIPTASTFTYSHSMPNASSSGGTATHPLVPINNRGVFVTPERYAALFGCGGEPCARFAAHRAGLPRWLDAAATSSSSVHRVTGLGWCERETGAIHQSPFEMVWQPYPGGVRLIVTERGSACGHA